MTMELLIVLLAGLVLMCLLMAFQMKWYSVPGWKGIPVSVALALTGVAGSYLWYFVENGSFGGRSLFGSIFFAPVVFLPVAKLLRISYQSALDFCAPAGCLTLALVKIQCLRDSCCGGMVLFVDENGMFVRFPSQIAEMAAFLVIAGCLLWMSTKKIHQGWIFPWFLALYGAARFVLNFFRNENDPYLLGLTAGSFWGLCAFVIGTAILIKHYSKPKRKKRTPSKRRSRKRK